MSSTPTPPPMQVARSRDVMPIKPTNTEDIKRTAQFMVAAGAAPASYKEDWTKVAIAIMKGLEIGWLPMQAVQNMYVINGIPTVYGDGAMALVLASGQCDGAPKEWIEGTGDDRVAYCQVKRVRSEPTARSFSMRQAAAAGLVGKPGPWRQYPERMLQMRARAYALRDAFADVLMGMRIHEEVADYMPDDSPAQVSVVHDPFADAQPDKADGQDAAIDVTPEPMPESVEDVPFDM